jgi:hypothetical protein
LTVFCLETMQLAPRKSLKGIHSKLALENIRQRCCSRRTEKEQRWWKKVVWIVKLSIRKDSALHAHTGFQETDDPYKMTKKISFQQRRSSYSSQDIAISWAHGPSSATKVSSKPNHLISDSAVLQLLIW